MSAPHFHRTLSPLLLWGLGVGYVISGMYFGWNIGLDKGGTLGMAIATGIVVILYVSFTLCYAELACAIPRAGGAFDYAEKAFGQDWGFVAGMAQWIEFVFAPPAIAMGIGAYFHLFFPDVSVTTFAVLAYFIFTLLNMAGVRYSAFFELIITCIAVAELLLFSGLTLPHVQLNFLQQNAFPHGWTGVFAALPFAIWFFLGIEGLANVAEETKNPQRDITRGFVGSLLTLVTLCVLIFISSCGVAGWEKIVYLPDGQITDAPLPLALHQVTGGDSLWYRMLVSVGIFGFIASFNGRLLAAGRATFEFGRSRHLPQFLAYLHPRSGTPWIALLVNMLVGILAIYSGKTAEIITISVFGALVLYGISALAHLRLRKHNPDLQRPFLAPLFPFLPLLAGCLSLLCLTAMIYFNILLFCVFLTLLAVGFLFYRLNK